MYAEIISIGSEILQGQIIDTNANYIAKKLAKLNIEVKYISAVGDDDTLLFSLLKRAANRSTIIITTGGLGPTEDDITYQTIARALNLKLIKYPEAEKSLKNFLSKINMELSHSNLKQTYLPETAKIIINKYGTAPAMILEKDKCAICSLPGVPREMKKLLVENILPYLQEKFPSLTINKSRNLRITGLGESSVNELICDYIKEKTNLSFGIYAHPEDIQVQVTARATKEKEVDILLEEATNDLKSILGNYIFGYEKQSLAEVVGVLLKSKKLKIAIAESCTGGMLGELITRTPGSSDYFLGGIISYHSAIKKDLLNVPMEIISKYGEVSEQVAKLMAEGVRKCCQADIGLSITGIAGPGGATTQKKVGLVYMALADDKNTIFQKHQLFRGRQVIRLRATFRALNMLRIYLQNN